MMWQHMGFCRRLAISCVVALLAVAGCGSPGTTSPTHPGPSDLAFTTLAGDQVTNWGIHADGSGLTKLTPIPEGGFCPVWSPDGRQIAFDMSGGTWVLNADGSGQRRLIEDSAHPVWSPDGKSIAVVAVRAGNFDIYAVPVSGSGEMRLTTDPGGDTFPAWSPDGKRIAFSAERGKSTGTNIWVMNADGSEQMKVVESPTAGDEFESWSPDGKQLVFRRITSQNAGDIWVMNADGSGQTKLVSDGTNPDEGGVPVWSPDGSRIAFVSSRDGNNEIYVMNPDGSGQTRLTNNSTDDRCPTWRP